MHKSSSIGQLSFYFFLEKLEILFKDAKQKPAASTYIYEQDGRTLLFMLEALSRLYKNLCSKKILSKLYKHTKAAEDAMGTYDHYLFFLNTFKTDERIPIEIIQYLQNQVEEASKNLNRVLNKNIWQLNHSFQLKKFRKKLKQIEWLTNQNETSQIKKIYLKQTIEYSKEIISHKIDFDHVEKDVHELRRNIRWLSIYAQAFRGLFALKKEKDLPNNIKIYLSTKIAQSPYTRLPAPVENSEKIYLQKNHFYALSWLIKELGLLKDQGLRILILAEAEKEIHALSSEEAIKKAYTYCDAGYPNIKEILQKAKAICEPFFKNKILENLLLQ